MANYLLFRIREDSRGFDPSVALCTQCLVCRATIVSCPDPSFYVGAEKKGRVNYVGLPILLTLGLVDLNFCAAESATFRDC